ncbi:MAG: SiaB family protein kinase [Bernardetiaceae bacterium]|nr:SiaB family protein kinase [Bernardetiaceae bacterium]
MDNYYRKIQSEAIIMSYKGAATASLLNSMIDVAQTRLSLLTEQGQVKKRVFSILVELLQNIYHHFQDTSYLSMQEDDAIIFVLARDPNGYHVSTGNYVSNSEVPRLQAKLDTVNQATADELRARYQQVLNNGTLTQKSAGLGFLDMARKSGNKLEYEFKPYDHQFSFFSLTVHITAPQP